MHKLKNPDKRTLYCLHKLRMSEDWKTVREWLEDSLSQLRQRNDVEMEEWVFRQNQGACQVLADLLDLQDKALEILKRTEHRKG